MVRGGIGLLLWGLAISALGIWHSVSWVQNTDVDKGIYKIAVGVFCLFIGIGVVAFNLILRGKEEDK